MKNTAKYDEVELEILQAWEAGALKPSSNTIWPGKSRCIGPQRMQFSK